MSSVSSPSYMIVKLDHHVKGNGDYSSVLFLVNTLILPLPSGALAYNSDLMTPSEPEVQT